MLNTTEHGKLLMKTKMLKNDFPCLKFIDAVFILLINVKMPTIVDILTFMSRIDLILSVVEHEKSFITLPKVMPETCIHSYLSEPTSTSLLCVCQQQGLLQDFMDAQAHLSLHCLQNIMNWLKMLTSGY